MYVFPAGIMIVPPLPHCAIAEVMAGTSSVLAVPAEAGVHVARFEPVEEAAVMRHEQSSERRKDVLSDMLGVMVT
jgi:hypothetical protein